MSHRYQDALAPMECQDCHQVRNDCCWTCSRCPWCGAHLHKTEGI